MITKQDLKKHVRKRKKQMNKKGQNIKRDGYLTGQSASFYHKVHQEHGLETIKWNFLELMTNNTLKEKAAYPLKCNVLRTFFIFKKIASILRDLIFYMFFKIKNISKS